MPLLRKALLPVLVLFFPLSAVAEGKLADSKLCTGIMPEYERTYGIPKNILLSISQNESGIWHHADRKTVPWPWTIGVAGRGFYFRSEADAVEALIKLVNHGYKNIDIGCMQVNLAAHPQAFPSLDYAFNPDHNVNYAAKFLRKNYDETKSWKTAISYYHSRTPSYGNAYLSRIINRWFKNTMNNNEIASVDNLSPQGQQQAAMSAVVALPPIPSPPRARYVYDTPRDGQKIINVRKTSSIIKVRKKNERGVKVVRMQPTRGGDMIIKSSSSNSGSEKKLARNSYDKNHSATANNTPIDFIFN